MAILYGNNGCGKTTLLRLIFHALSPARNRRHRTELHAIPFGRFECALNDGTVIAAERRKGVHGPLRLTIAAPGEPDVTGVYSKTLEDGFESTDFETRYLEALNKLGLSIYYLTDDRELISDSLPQRSSETESGPHFEFFHNLVDSPTFKVRQERNESDLTRTLRVTHEWIRRQLIQGANAGTENANSIYLEIMKRLAKRTATPDFDDSAHEQLTASLANLEATSGDYARFGFTPALDVGQMNQLLGSAQPAQRDTMVTVLEPYVRGIIGKLDSLSAIKSSTARLVDGLTAFFSGGKRVEYDVSTGFRFISAAGAPLRPDWLSSGEQHLIKLFCCTIISRDNPSVFLVDEPELSLNVKWQRVLLDELAGLAEGSPNQFFFATHSIEIIARHRHSVVELVPT